MGMNETQFVALLGAYGADLARWPDAERARAELFLRSAPHRIRDIWDSEQSFDDLLALEADAPASRALEAAILRQAGPVSRSQRRPWRLAWPSLPAFARRGWAGQSAGVKASGLKAGLVTSWATGGMIAASLAVGVAVGYAGEPAPGEQDYTKMLTVSGGGAGAVLLTALDEVPH